MVALVLTSILNLFHNKKYHIIIFQICSHMVHIQIYSPPFTFHKCSMRSLRKSKCTSIFSNFLVPDRNFRNDSGCLNCSTERPQSANYSSDNPCSSSMIMLCKIRHASMMTSIGRRSHCRTGFFRISNIACNTPKTHSTSLRAPSWHLVECFFIFPIGSWIGCTKHAHSG